MAVYAGRQAQVYIDLNGVGSTGSPNWAAIGQQRGGSISRTAETADSTHKQDDGWPSAVITRTPWSVSVDGALNPVDPAYTYLVTQWKAKAKVWVMSDESAYGGEKVEGLAIITDLSKEYPEGDVVTFTAEFQGDGELFDSP